MEKILIGIVAVLVIAFGAYWIISMSSVNTALAPTATTTSSGDQYAYNPQSGNVSPPAGAVQTGSNGSGQGSAPQTTNQNKKYMKAILHTNKGDITIEFFDADAPNTVANFTKLAGAGFYNGTKFHRVIKGFMIQGGDPLSKDDAMMARWGTGGPGYQFADEIRANNHNVVGTISMANAGPNTNGSQFFINTANNNFLDTKHTTFGKVTAGMDVVTAIESTQTGANDRPVSPMTITSVTLE
jgi:cyclophilin family peptidyl-prolyl cis-trans isomerase